MALECQNISFSYAGTPVLRQVSLSARRGEMTCLLGASGSGKTTLLNLVAGLLSVTDGSVLLDGEVMADVRHSPAPEKRPVGIVFQDGALFPHMSAAKNVGFGTDVDAKTVATLLDQVGLTGFEKRFPHELSSGQRQRIALARTLAPNPDVVLLDEPFANLDVSLRKQLGDLTRSILLKRECVALMVTHDPDEALELADQIVFFEDGAILQAGTPETLYDQPAAMAVARAIGGGTTIDATRTGDVVETAFGRFPITSLGKSIDGEGPFKLLVREQGVAVSSDPNGTARVARRSFRGATSRVVLETSSGQSLSAIIPRSDGFSVGDPVKIDLVPGEAHGFSVSEFS